MSYLLGIDFMYDTPKNRVVVEKIIQECNGQMDCVTDKNAVFVFKDADSMKKADYELYKLGIHCDSVESA
jgi:hypothetical protein